MSTYGVIRTSEEAFKSCVGIGTDSVNISSELPHEYVSIGRNYFIVDVLNNVTEACEAGYRVNITVVENNCGANDQATPCSGHGHCLAPGNQYVYKCTCCPGYEGKVCQKAVPQTTPVTPRPCDICLNGGTCFLDEEQNETGIFNVSDVSCQCAPLFSGDRCELRLDHCKSNPCRHGVCVERPTSYQCFCVPGFHGKQCELEYNECLSTPCKHGGTCVDRIDRFTCACSHGFTGPTCEKKVNMCQRNPCRLNATCSDVGNTFHCACPRGHTGRVCEYAVNECKSNPCQNQGTCIDLENRFECKCPLTFAGIHCEYMLDVFAPPLEGTDLTGSKHVHNLYIVAGTLSGAVLIGMVVLFACYCKMHETYKQVLWRRGGYKKRSLSCPDLDSCGESTPPTKPRLSVGAIWEATSLCHDNAAYEHQQLQQPLNSERI